MLERRLVTSFVVATTVAWVTLVTTPLKGQDAIAESTEQEPGFVIDRNPAVYPLIAMQDGIRGEVVVELTFDENGEIVGTRVLSGPEELRLSGLQTALRGDYQLKSARSLQVVVDYSNGPAAVLAVDGRPIIGLPDGNIVMAGKLDEIRIDGLQEPLLTEFENRLRRFRDRLMSTDLLREILEAVDASAVGSVTAKIVRPTPIGNSILDLVFGGESPTSYPTVMTPARRVDSAVQAEKLIRRIDPNYPSITVEYKIQGVVIMDVWINPDGHVASIGTMIGHPLFISPAHQAVSQWVYEPTAEADNVVTEVTVEFTLPKDEDY